MNTNEYKMKKYRSNIVSTKKSHISRLEKVAGKYSLLIG